jgi:hypothetical protein
MKQEVHGIKYYFHKIVFNLVTIFIIPSSMRIFLFFLLLSIPFKGITQIGGDQTYEFLNLNTSARVIALGGNTNAIDDGDLSLAYHNPAILKEGMESQLLLNYVNYFADINYGYAAFALPSRKMFHFAAGMHYLDYGVFQEADETGNITGEFGASEYAFNLTASRRIDTNFRVGVNLKPVISNLYQYNSFGLALDAGVVYTDTSGLFSAGLVLKNMGYQFKPYHPETRESLPFEIQLGASYKLRYAPFRFIAVVNHLEKPDLTYQNPDYNLTGYSYNQDFQKTNSGLENAFDQIMRHVVLGVEITPLNNFYIRFGYDYRRRQELKVDTKLSTVGFSWGFGVKLYKFYLNYGRGTYHLAGSTHHFSLRTDLNKLFAW